MVTVNLYELPQRELIRLILVQHGRLLRIAKASRDAGTAPWELKRLIAEELETFSERTRYVQRAAEDQRILRSQAVRNERRWDSFNTSPTTRPEGVRAK